MATNKKSPKVLRNGVENLIPMNERTPEERKRIGQLGVEARKKKRDEKMALQQAMKALLTMDIPTQKQKQVLMHMGFKSGELTNQNLLMVALFKKGYLAFTIASLLNVEKITSISLNLEF